MPAWAALIPVALWAIDKMTKGGVSGGGAISDATNNMGNSMTKAMSSIDASTKQAMGYNEPYMNPEVFKKMSELVQSGAFQTPYGQSFQAHQWNTPGMNFNPTKGKFGMTPWQTGQPPPSFTPQGLPPGMAGVASRPVAPPVVNFREDPRPAPPVSSGPLTMQQIVTMGLNRGQSLAPIETRLPPEMLNSPGLITPQDAVNQYKPFNPRTDRYPIPPIGSGPTMPGGIPGRTSFPMPGGTMPTFGVNPFLMPRRP